MKRLILSALLLVSASGWAQQDISRAFERGVVTTERPQQRDIYIYTYDDLYPPPPPPPRSYFYYEGGRNGVSVRIGGADDRWYAPPPRVYRNYPPPRGYYREEGRGGGNPGRFSGSSVRFDGGAANR